MDCPTCDGEGSVWTDRAKKMPTAPCPDCGGIGEMRPLLRVECKCGARFPSALNAWENYQIRGEVWTERCPSCEASWIVELFTAGIDDPIPPKIEREEAIRVMVEATCEHGLPNGVQPVACGLCWRRMRRALRALVTEDWISSAKASSRMMSGG